MTATVQVPNTPEFFAKVEKRLAEAIHEQTTALSMAERSGIQMHAREIEFNNREASRCCAVVRVWRGIYTAMKAGLPVNLDAELYWSLTNE